MCEHDHPERPRRRQAIATLCALGAAGLLGRRLRAAPALALPDDACVLSPSLTIGPYFVDERLKRADLTAGASTAFIADAVPLQLDIAVVSASAACAPLAGVQIDLWHCHAGGLYSDEADNGTLGETWLRGYQISDAAGRTAFRTIYPGWYRGRTIHIHAMARWFDAVGQTTYQFITQLFFDDALNDSVLARAPYNTRGNRDTSNARDGIYAPSMQVALSPAAAGGYAGAATLALDLAPQLADAVFADGFETA